MYITIEKVTLSKDSKKVKNRDIEVSGKRVFQAEGQDVWEHVCVFYE